MMRTSILRSALPPRCHRLSGLTALVLLSAVTSLHAQISITSAVDLAIRNSPRVKMSDADLTKARALLDESKDVYIPTLTAGAALLQGLAAARGAGGAGNGMAPITIDRDPVTDQASIRLPLPEPAVLQQLAKAFEPWLR